MVEDLGSGLIAPMPGVEEATVADSLRAGVDVVTFSGDKLLGGPQAGLVVGGAEPLRAMRANPLYRALRVDKMTLAAIDVVLGIHEAGRAETDLPTLRMLAMTEGEVRAPGGRPGRAPRRRTRPSSRSRIVAGASAAGGGAAPTAEIPTALLRIEHRFARRAAPGGGPARGRAGGGGARGRRRARRRPADGRARGGGGARGRAPPRGRRPRLTGAPCHRRRGGGIIAAP